MFLPMTNPPPQPPSQTRRALRPLYFVAGLILVPVGIAGYFLPVMPGTIWLILAAACFARSSPQFEAWLVNHPKFGPSVVAWRRYGAIPRRIKVIAIAMMAVSFVVVAVSHPPALWLWILGAVLLACALFVMTRPAGPRTSGS
jgi:uncharacterized membrane protein YbaN (DUF454 family)